MNSPKDRVDPVLISSEVLLWASPPPPEPLRRPPSATSPRTGRDHERLAATISTSSAVSPYSRYTIASMSRSTSPIRNKSGASFSTDAKYSRRRSSPKARRFGSTPSFPLPQTAALVLGDGEGDTADEKRGRRSGRCYLVAPKVIYHFCAFISP